MSKVIICANQKGGVAKTTTTANLGIGLAREVLYQVYGSSIHIFENVIPMSVRAAETPAEGVSIYKHDAKGKVAIAYEALTKEVISHE